MTGALLILAVSIALQAASDLPVLVLPAGDDAWVVRIVTTGGFTGRGAGSVTASSAGDVECAMAAGCPRRLAADTLSSLWRRVEAIPLRRNAPESSPHRSICADCVTRTMTVYRRDAEGDHTIGYTWDESTATAVPAAALRLHAAMFALAAARSQ